GRLTGIFSPDGTSQRTGYDERGRVNVTTQGRRAIEFSNGEHFNLFISNGKCWSR
ncbi:RHS repeat protein, partial [Escherichia coli]|nr:RHS repeat protein [Escherichia coli]